MDLEETYKHVTCSNMSSSKSEDKLSSYEDFIEENTLHIWRDVT